MKVSSGNAIRSLAIIAAVITLTACSSAKKSTDVSSVRVPVSPYMRMTCDELFSEQRVLQNNLEMTRAAVDKSYNSDKTTEVVAWVLFAPAALFLEGNQKEATDFAATKGQYEAVQEAVSIKKCASEMKAQETPPQEVGKKAQENAPKPVSLNNEAQQAPTEKKKS